MLARLNSIVRALRIAVARRLRRPAQGELLYADAVFGRVLQARRAIGIAAVIGAAGWVLLSHPPMATVGSGEMGVRTNLLTGDAVQWRDGSILVIPGLHEAQVFAMRDRTYKPAQLASAAGHAPVQSVEGLSVGIDLTVRYALDPSRLAHTARTLPGNVDSEIVEPAVQNVVYKVFER